MGNLTRLVNRNMGTLVGAGVLMNCCMVGAFLLFCAGSLWGFVAAGAAAVLAWPVAATEWPVASG